MMNDARIMTVFSFSKAPSTTDVPAAEMVVVEPLAAAGVHPAEVAA